MVILPFNLIICNIQASRKKPLNTHSFEFKHKIEFDINKKKTLKITTTFSIRYYCLLTLNCITLHIFMVDFHIFIHRGHLGTIENHCGMLSMPKIWEHSACADPNPAPTPNAIDAHRVVGLRNNKTPNATPANAPYMKRRNVKSIHLSYFA